MGPKMTFSNEKSLFEKYAGKFSMDAIFGENSEVDRNVKTLYGKDYDWIRQLKVYFDKKKVKYPEQEQELSGIINDLSYLDSAIGALKNGVEQPGQHSLWSGAMFDLDHAKQLQERLDRFNEATGFELIADDEMQAAFGLSRKAEDVVFELESQEQVEEYENIGLEMDLLNDNMNTARSDLQKLVRNSEANGIDLNDLDYWEKLTDSGEKKYTAEMRSLIESNNRLKELESSYSQEELNKAKAENLLARVVMTTYERLQFEKALERGDEASKKSVFLDKMRLAKRAEESALKQARVELPRLGPLWDIPSMIEKAVRKADNTTEEEIKREFDRSSKRITELRKVKAPVETPQGKLLKSTIEANGKVIDAQYKISGALEGMHRNLLSARGKLSNIKSRMEAQSDSLRRLTRKRGQYLKLDKRQAAVDDKVQKFLDHFDDNRRFLHWDSREYTNIRTALEAYRNPPEGADREELMRNLKTAASTYLAEKEKHVHGKTLSSSMRYQRLKYARDILNFSERSLQWYQDMKTEKEALQVMDAKLESQNSQRVDLTEYLAEHPGVTSEVMLNTVIDRVKVGFNELKASRAEQKDAFQKLKEGMGAELSRASEQWKEQNSRVLSGEEEKIIEKNSSREMVAQILS